MVPIVQKYIPAGHPNRPGKILASVTALIFHYTANEDRNMGDTATAVYFSRSWHKGSDGAYYEGKVDPPLPKKPTPFAYGSAQVIADEDSVTETMPLNEVAWGCGDRRFPYTELNKGQQPAARIWLSNQSNQRTLNIEICNNADWDKACQNAADWAVQYLLINKRKVSLENSLNCQVMDKTLQPGEILLLRHFDVSGKVCPKPFVDDNTKWVDYITAIASRANV